MKVIFSIYSEYVERENSIGPTSSRDGDEKT